MAPSSFFGPGGPADDAGPAELMACGKLQLFAVRTTPATSAFALAAAQAPKEGFNAR